jgi:hypothetical protein
MLKSIQNLGVLYNPENNGSSASLAPASMGDDPDLTTTVDDERWI